MKTRIRKDNNGSSSMMMMKQITFTFLIGLMLLVPPVTPTITPAQYPNDEEWISCEEFQETSSLKSCICSVAEEEGFRINCDNAVFPTDFPTLPFRQPISYFSQRFVKYQNIPPQALLPSSVPLRTLDLSNNWLRRLTEKSLEGLSETLEILDLSSNLLGDQLNPIFSTSEFKRLPRLKVLALGGNMISHVDGGVIDGCLSLEEFYLDDNELKYVPSSSLKGPNALKVLDLSLNFISELKLDDFHNTPSLIFLNMSHNELTSIQGGSFRTLSNLKYLDVSHNRVARLNSDSFNGLETIEELDLSYNLLTQIPLASIKPLTSLRVLKLSGNLLQNLEMAKDMRVLSSLEVLDLSRNRLSEIPKDFFAGMSRLKELNLGVNQLRTIPPSIFEGLPGLVSLNLIDNNLLTFPSQAIGNLTNLNSLTLDYNRISVLTTPPSSLNITKLSIAYNLIREIPTNTFVSFPNLVNLNLRGNLIQSMDEVLLPSGLQSLDVGYNSIKSIPRFQLPTLESLLVDHNQVGSLVQHNFVLLGNLRELDVSFNAINSFYDNSFDGLDSLESLNMAGNRLESLPSSNFGNMYGVETLNFSRNSIKSLGVIHNMVSLMHLDLSYNELANLKREMFRNTSNLITIDLRHNKLSSFKGFSGSFDRLKSLDLSNNHISYVYPNSFESFGQLWNLNLADNRFTLFPTEFLKPCKQIRYVGLGSNQIKNLNEMDFSNFAHLRSLDLSNNLIEFVNQNAFLNSTQLQYLDLSGNKLESLDPNVFNGILRLELDVSNNYLSMLPASIFERNHVAKLHVLNISNNAFVTIPHEALQRQYFYLEHLHMRDNRIAQVPQNLNVLVNVKHLDLSYNPLSEGSLKNILSEPKTVRTLELSNCSIKSIPVLEMPFLRTLNLSNNGIRSFDEAVFQRTTLLESLDLSNNQFYDLQPSFPASLKTLDLSGNSMNLISGHHQPFPLGLESLKLNNLEHVMKVEKSALALKNLKTLEIYNLPKLGYLDIRGLLSQLRYLENFDLEVKDYQIADQIHPGLNSKTKRIGLRGKRVRSISTGTFAGLTSPSVTISLLNTSLTILPSILVPVPMSSKITLDLSNSKITNLPPPFLTQNIRFQGLSPTCDCNAVSLVKYLKAVGSSNVFCSGPSALESRNVLDLKIEELTCEPGSSTTPPPIPSTISTTTTTTQDDIIWSLAPTTTSSSKNKNKSRGDNLSSTTTKLKPQQEINNMDSLIFGIVGGVIVLIIVFVVIIICFVKLTNSTSDLSPQNHPHQYHTHGIAPSIVSVGPHPNNPAKCTCPHTTNKSDTHSLAMVPHNAAAPIHQSSYSTLRSNKYLHALAIQQSKYSTMSPSSITGGAPPSMYAFHHHAQQQQTGAPSLTMYPNTTNALTMGSLYNANPTYSGSFVSPPRNAQYHHHQNNSTNHHVAATHHHQGSSIYGSMPYYSHHESEYDTRR